MNTDADYHWRNATSVEELMKDCTEVCKPEKIDIVKSDVTVQPSHLCNVSVGKLVLSPEAEIDKIKKADLVRSQKDDDVIGPVYEAVSQGCYPDKDRWKELPHGSKLMMHHFKKLEVVEDGVLVRKMANNRQVVLPGRYHHIVYAELHKNMAHLCVEKVIDLAQQRFYWPYMAKQITGYIQKKCRCVINKNRIFKKECL